MIDTTIPHEHTSHVITMIKSLRKLSPKVLHEQIEKMKALKTKVHERTPFSDYPHIKASFRCTPGTKATFTHVWTCQNCGTVDMIGIHAFRDKSKFLAFIHDFSAKHKPCGGDKHGTQDTTLSKAAEDVEGQQHSPTISGGALPDAVSHHTRAQV